MPKYSGKPVNSLRVIAGKSRVQLSPVHYITSFIHQLRRAQVQVIHDLSDLSTPSLSPSKIALSPLIEHYFYPVSTAPINNPTKRN
jgi:hypothetical protein